MTISPSEKIRNYALDQVDGPYIMGATAQPCTPKYRKARAAQYPDSADKIFANCPVLNGTQSGCDGCPHQGKLAHDCAQLVLHAAECAGITLPSGATSQWTKVKWAIKGEIAQMPMDVVCFVYHKKSGTKNTMSHTGIYMGDGTVVDARGHASGVKHEDVASYPWTHYAIPDKVVEEVGKDMSERPAYAEMRRDTIRMGAKGNAVAEAQTLLNAWDSTLALEVDGIFGSATKAAVIKFQAAHGLTEDGVLGPKTWVILLGYDVDDGDDDPEIPDDVETVAPAEPSVAMLIATVEQHTENLLIAVNNLIARIRESDKTIV